MWAPAFAAVAAAAAPAPEPSEDNSKCEALGRRGLSQHMPFLQVVHSHTGHASSNSDPATSVLSV